MCSSDLTLIHREHATTTTARLPLLGLIAAGEPIEALENPEMVDVPVSLLHPDHYVLQVKGNSMIDEQIHDKDYIVARKTNTARSGQIVVALINGEATLKYYVQGPGGVELHPRNPDFPIIKVDPKDDFHININNGSPKRVINLNEDSSGLNSNAEMIHENPKRK